MALRPLGLCRHRPPARRPLSTPPIRASTGHTSVQRAASFASDRDRRCANNSPVSSPATSRSFSSFSKCVGLRPVGECETVGRKQRVRSNSHEENALYKDNTFHKLHLLPSILIFKCWIIYGSSHRCTKSNTVSSRFSSICSLHQLLIPWSTVAGLWLTVNC